MNAPAPQRLTLADQTLVNALAWLVLQQGESKADQQMVLDVMREVLPNCNGKNPIMTPLIKAADGYLHFFLGAESAKGMRAASDQARPPIQAFLKLRAAQALDAWRAAQTEDLVQ